MPLSEEERALLDAEFAAPKTDVSRVVERASSVNPQRHAEVLDIATRRQLPTSTVENNFDELKKQDTIEASDPSTWGPHLTKFFEDPDNAALAHDDIDNLKETEKTFRLAPVGQQLQSIASGLKGIAGALAAGQHDVTSGAYGLLEGGVDILRGMSTDQMINAGLIKDDKVLQPLSDFFGKARKNSQQWGDYLAPDAEGLIERGAYGGLRSVSSNMGSMAISVVAGNPAYALGLMTAQTGGHAMGEGKDQGMQIDDRLVYAVTDSAIEYYTERNPVTKLIEDLIGNAGFVKFFVSQQVSEGLGEQAATALQDLNAWALLPENKDKPFSAYIAERPNAALETMVSTFVATSVNTGVMHGISKLAKPAVTETDRTAANVLSSMSDQDKLDKLITLGQSSKLGGIATEKYKEFLKGAGSDNKIYVPMDIIRDVPNLSPSIADQLNDLGGDVEIGVDEFMSTMVHDEKLMAIIRPHMTMGLNKMSKSEIESGAGDQTVRSLLERANLKAQEKVELDAYQDNVYEQIKSTGIVPEKQAKLTAALDAAVVATMARERGLTIAQVIERKNTEIVGPGRYKKMVDASEVMDQPGKEYPMAPETEWYGDSDYESRGGKIQTVTPDEFLANAPPLDVNDPMVRENVDELKNHILSGGTLDPLSLYKAGATKARDSDGRHRALAAKELGINKIPVIDFTGTLGKPSNVTDITAKLNEKWAKDPTTKAKGDFLTDMASTDALGKALGPIDTPEKESLWESWLGDNNIRGMDTIGEMSMAEARDKHLQEFQSKLDAENLGLNIKADKLFSMTSKISDKLSVFLDWAAGQPDLAQVAQDVRSRIGVTDNITSMQGFIEGREPDDLTAVYSKVDKNAIRDILDTYPEQPIARFQSANAHPLALRILKNIGAEFKSKTPKLDVLSRLIRAYNKFERSEPMTLESLGLSEADLKQKVKSGETATWSETRDREKIMKSWGFVNPKQLSFGENKYRFGIKPESTDTLYQVQRQIDVLTNFYEKVADQEDGAAFRTPTSPTKNFVDMVDDLTGDKGWFAKKQDTNKKYLYALDGKGRAPVMALYTEKAVDGMPHPDVAMELYYEGSLDREGNVQHTNPYVSILPGGNKEGNAMYQMAMMWAHNNDKVLAPDHAGITMVNRLRRTEAMISSALRFKTTKHLEPHHHQFVGLLPMDMYNRLEDEHGGRSDINDFREGGKYHDIELALLDLKRKYWKVDTGVNSVYKSNLRNLMVASQRLVERRFPDVATIGFKPTGEYYDRTTGEAIDPKQWLNDHREKDEVVSAGIGHTTLRRASITQSALLAERELGRLVGGRERGGIQSPSKTGQSEMVGDGSDWFDASPTLPRLLYQRDRAKEPSDVQTRRLLKRREVVKTLMNCLRG